MDKSYPKGGQKVVKSGSKAGQKMDIQPAKAPQKVVKILGSPQSYEVDLWGQKRWTRARLRHECKSQIYSASVVLRTKCKMIGREADVVG